MQIMSVLIKETFSLQELKDLWEGDYWEHMQSNFTLEAFLPLLRDVRAGSLDLVALYTTGHELDMLISRLEKMEAEHEKEVERMRNT